MEVELWGGPNSAINQVGLDDTAFVHRNSLFTIQFQSGSDEGSYPEGFGFLDGMVASIVDNMPKGWNYECVLRMLHYSRW